MTHQFEQTRFSTLCELLESEYLSIQMEFPYHNQEFREHWQKAKAKFLEQHGWTLEQFNAELDSRQKQKVSQAESKNG